MRKLTILALICMLSMVSSYPDYVPSLTCIEMFPYGHEVPAMNANSATSTPPYILTVNATTYQPGDVIEVFLNSTQSGNEEFSFYEGVFVQARRSDCTHPLYYEAIGTFFLDSDEDFLKTIECAETPDKAVRHMKHEHVYNSTIYWRAPSISVGHIYFRATVARRKTTFWTNVNSEYIEDSNSSSSLPAKYCTPRTVYVPCPEKPSGTGGAVMISPVFASYGVLFLGYIINQLWLI